MEAEVVRWGEIGVMGSIRDGLGDLRRWRRRRADQVDLLNHINEITAVQPHRPIIFREVFLEDLNCSRTEWRSVNYR